MSCRSSLTSEEPGGVDSSRPPTTIVSLVLSMQPDSSTNSCPMFLVRATLREDTAPSPEEPTPAVEASRLSGISLPQRPQSLPIPLGGRPVTG